MKALWGWMDGYWKWAWTHPITFFIELVFTSFLGLILGFAIGWLGRVLFP